MEVEKLNKLRIYATLTNTLDKYVYLREDEQGRYIEYAFIEGAPHDNRCLSWYVKPHPKYKERYGSTPKISVVVGEVYALDKFTCGLHSRIGKNRCYPGHPKKDCFYITSVDENGKKETDWSYDEPVKCACWDLNDVRIPDEVSMTISMDTAIEIFDDIKKYFVHEVSLKFKVKDTIRHKYYKDSGRIKDIKDGKYIFDTGAYILISEQDLWELQ